MVILLESSKITMQVTNHFRYMENTRLQPINTYFLFTGILITSTGIFNKSPTGIGILEKFLVGNGIVTPPPPSRPSKVAVIAVDSKLHNFFEKVHFWSNIECQYYCFPRIWSNWLWLHT